jgi:hypothetical protein
MRTLVAVFDFVGYVANVTGNLTPPLPSPILKYRIAV